MNFRASGVLEDFQIRNLIEKQDVIDYFVKKTNFQMVENKLTIDNATYSIYCIQDTNNEPDNKRVQGAKLLEDIAEGYNIIGLYPVLDSGNVCQDLCLVEWENSKIKDILDTSKNPSLKLKLVDIRNSYVNDRIIQASSMKYASRVFTINLFNDRFNLSEELDHNHFRDLSDEEIQTRVQLMARNGSLQKSFRESLLEKHSCRCQICNINKPFLLRASHILPVASIVRLINVKNIVKADLMSNPDNGLLLCANHDILFDKGYISFDDSGYIMIAAELNGLYDLLNIDDNLRIQSDSFSSEYMDFHRNNIFKGNI